MRPKPGDWVRFRRGGVLVIGVVQYVRRHRTTNAEWDVSTDVGEVWDSSIEEIRPAVADAALRGDDDEASGTPPDPAWEGEKP